MSDPRYDIAAVPEHCRKYLKRFGNEFERFVGVDIGGRDIDLRETEITIEGDLSEFSGRVPGAGKPVAIDLTPLRALVNLKTIKFKRAMLENQHILAELQGIEAIDFLQVPGFEGYLPPGVKRVGLRNSRKTSMYTIRSEYASLVEYLDYEGSSIGTLAAELELPNLKWIGLSGTPIDSRLNSGFKIEKVFRFLMREWVVVDQRVKEQISELRKRGVDVSFARSGAW